MILFWILAYVVVSVIVGRYGYVRMVDNLTEYEIEKGVDFEDSILCAGAGLVWPISICVMLISRETKRERELAAEKKRQANLREMRDNLREIEKWDC